jgi:aquaporin related protein
MDTTKPNLRNTSVATLNIRASQTIIAEADPLKKLFRRIFSSLPSSTRGHVVAALGELIGTLMFIFMAMSGAQVAIITSNRTLNGNIDSSIGGASPQMLLYISLSVGFSLVVTAWIFFRISGGLFNPVVCILANLGLDCVI